MARIRCDECGHDFFVAYSCRCRIVCPSCSTKRSILFGEKVREIVKPVSHLHITFTPTGNMNSPRRYHTATVLYNGKVLITGGTYGAIDEASKYLSSAELYDPITGTFSYTGSMSIRRILHTATLLPNGKVLISGGAIDWNISGGVATDIVEIYDPDTGTFSRTGNLAKGNFFHTATLLDNGKVLIAGGINSSSSVPEELYDPSTGVFSATGTMSKRRYYHAAEKLSDGKVLITGGGDGTVASLQTS